MEHCLKCWPEYFEALRTEKKTFEVRKDDRNFKLGDSLSIEEFDPTYGYTGRWIKADITYVLRGGEFGILRGYCVMGIKRIKQ